MEKNNGNMGVAFTILMKTAPKSQVSRPILKVVLKFLYCWLGDLKIQLK